MNLLDTLQNTLTPILLNDTSAVDAEEPKKRAVFGHLYALLGLGLATTNQSTLSETLTQFTQNPTHEPLSALFGGSFAPIYESLGAHHHLSGTTIETLTNTALPKICQALTNLAGGTAVADFLSTHKEALLASLPAPLLGSLALANVAPTAAHAVVSNAASTPAHGIANTAPTTTHSTQNNDAPAGSGFAKTFLPIIGLLVASLIAWLMIKGCQKNPTPIATPNTTTQTTQNLSPATLTLTLNDKGDGIAACTGTVGNLGLGEQIKASIARAFGADTCAFDTLATTDSTLPAMQYIPQMLGFAKGVPNATLAITGKTITLSGASLGDLEALRNKLAGALPTDFVVAFADALPVDTQEASQNNSAQNTDNQGTDGQNESAQSTNSDGTNQGTESTTTSNQTDSTSTEATDTKALVQSSLDNAKTALEALKEDNPDELIKALNLQIINFATNSANIPADNKAILDMAVKHLKGKDIKITITGHTDNRGKPDGNKLLSEARARAVRDYLVAQGVSPKTLKVVGKGDSEPAFDNDSEEGRFKNRRIEFGLTQTK